MEAWQGAQAEAAHGVSMTAIAIIATLRDEFLQHDRYTERERLLIETFARAAISRLQDVPPMNDFERVRLGQQLLSQGVVC